MAKKKASPKQLANQKKFADVAKKKAAKTKAGKKAAKK